MPLPYRIAPSGISALGNGFPTDMSLMDAYRWLQSQCEGQLGTEVCSAFLPENPIFLPPNYKTELPWYLWLLIGVLVGKIIL